MKYGLALLLFVLSAGLAGLSFEAEELDFTLHLHSWELDGLYHFANYADSAVVQLIYFPVPTDSMCESAELKALEITDDSLCTCQLAKQDEGGFGFYLQMPERSFCTLRINYSQKLSGNRARYIITTANAWGKPLPYAKYTLHVGEEVKLTSLPFPDPQGGEGHYYWEFEQFSPSHEFEVGFDSWN